MVIDSNGLAGRRLEYLRDHYHWLLVIIAYFVAIFLTTGYFWADAADYVSSVVAFHEGRNASFIEFGHLLWRPLGWLLWTSLFDLSDPLYWRLQVFTVFRVINLFLGLAATLAFFHILISINVSRALSSFFAIVFITSHACLNFVQTGTSYAAALAFFVIGIAFIVSRSSRFEFVAPFLGGVSLALAAGFWIAFVWVIPSVLIISPILYGMERRNFINSAIVLLSFSVTIFIVFGLAAYSLSLNSASEILAWIKVSSHGIETRGLGRTIFGLARSFVFMSDGGAQIKAWLLGDENQTLTVWTALYTLALVGGFYFSMAVSATILSRDRFGRTIILWALIGIAPLFLFAVFFDGAAVERHLPAIPIILIVAAIALEKSRSTVLFWMLIAIFSVFGLINMLALSEWNQSKTIASISERARLVATQTKTTDMVYLPHWMDDLVNFNRSFPDHPLNQFGNRQYNVVVTLGIGQTRTWREEFALRTLIAWKTGRDVWVSNRVLSANPGNGWNWIEGTDDHVRWQDLPNFFSQLTYDSRFGERDGFQRVANESANLLYFQSLTSACLEPGITDKRWIKGLCDDLK